MTIMASRKKSAACKCDLRTRVLGDGCSVCNPKFYAELMADQRREQAADRKAKRREKAKRLKTAKPSHSKLVKRADALFSLQVRSRGRCEANDGRPCKGPLQCAHGISRRYEWTRWNRYNAWCLCAGHHLFYTYRPEEWQQWMEDRMGEESYRIMRNEAIYGGKQDMDQVLAALSHAA